VNENHELAKVFCAQRITLAVKRVEFDTDRILHIILRSCWCHIIILIIHAPTGDKNVDAKAANTINQSVYLLNALNTT
jgi:hypothetical protein